MQLYNIQALRMNNKLINQKRKHLLTLDMSTIGNSYLELLEEFYYDKALEEYYDSLIPKEYASDVQINQKSRNNKKSTVVKQLKTKSKLGKLNRLDFVEDVIRKQNKKD
jgi:hypothetical protein